MHIIMADACFKIQMTLHVDLDSVRFSLMSPETLLIPQSIPCGKRQVGSMRTCIGKEELKGAEFVAVGFIKHDCHVLRRQKAHRGRGCKLAQHIDPACEQAMNYGLVIL